MAAKFKAIFTLLNFNRIIPIHPTGTTYPFVTHNKTLYLPPYP